MTRLAVERDPAMRQRILKNATYLGVTLDPELNARGEIQAARNLLPQVGISPEAEKAGLILIQKLQVDSLRAEITLFEAARAYAAADGRTTVTPKDIHVIAPMAVRLRRSKFMVDYFTSQETEEGEIKQYLASVTEEVSGKQ